MSHENLDRWRFYCKDYSSPDTYIDASWLFLVGACLQRRVWIESAWKVFGNQYTWLVAKPGVGKTVTDTVYEYLAFYDRKGKPAQFMHNDEGKGEQPDYLFPVAANATSLAKLLDHMCSRPQWVKENPDGTPMRPPYRHSTSTFILDEIVSLFKRTTDDLQGFMLSGYSCVREYKDDKVSAGLRYVANVCVNMLGGTQPAKFSEMLKNNIVDDGLTRRVFIIYETHSRKKMPLMPPYSSEQLVAKAGILRHILALSKLYGPMTMTEGATRLHHDYCMSGEMVINKSSYLENYYQSKNIHLLKIAMAHHFTDSLTMELEAEDIKFAIKYLSIIERNMHRAFQPRADTDEAEVKSALLARLAIETTPQRPEDLFGEFMLKTSWAKFTELVGDLVNAGALEFEGTKLKIKRYE